MLKSHRPAGSAVTLGAPAADKNPATSLYSALTRSADVTEVADGLCVGPSSEGLVEGVEVVDCDARVQLQLLPGKRSQVLQVLNKIKVLQT